MSTLVGLLCVKGRRLGRVERCSKADIKSLEDAMMSEWQCFREGCPLTNRDVKQSTVILKQRPAKAYALIHFSKNPPHCLHLARYF